MTYPYSRVKNADVRTTASRIIPAASPNDCLLWAVLGDSSDSLARRNLADGTLMDVVGSPTVNAGYSRTDVDDYFQSDVLEPGDTYEIFVLCRRSDTSANSATTGVVMGSFVGTGDASLLVYWPTNAVLRFQTSQGTNTIKTGAIDVTSTEAVKWKLYRGLVKWTSGTAGTITVYNETDETTGATVGTFTEAPDPGDQPIRIGTSYSPTLAGHSETNQVVIFNGERTSTERAAILAQMRGIALDMGITEEAA